MKSPIAEKLWAEYFEYVEGNISDAVAGIKDDVKALNITDSRVIKLLRLASCSSAPAGEKENATKMAFKHLVILLNPEYHAGVTA